MSFKKFAFSFLFLMIAFQAKSYAAFDFSYSFGDPFLAGSQTYIDSTSNAKLYNEGVVHAWTPITGAATEALTTPALITFHFNFGSETVDTAHLFLNMPTFHWSYSEGHNQLYGGTDGSSWELLMNVPTPAFAGANGGFYNSALPASLLGASDLWLQARLYSFGPSAHLGGALTNTAQFARYDVNGQNTTFSLDVNFTEGTAPPGAPGVPEPATVFLVGSGLLGLAFRRHKR